MDELEQASEEKDAPQPEAHAGHSKQSGQTVQAGSQTGNHMENMGHEDPAGHAGQMDHASHAEHDRHAPHDRHAKHEGHAGHEDHAGHVDHAEHEDHAGHVDHAGHADHAGHVDHTGHEKLFRQRFWVCVILSVPFLILSRMLQMLLHFSTPVFPGSQWIGPIFAVIVFLYGGVPFLQMALPELMARQPGMMTLISLAISVAFIYSLAALFLPSGDTFFWELVTLIDIMLLGHWLEMRSVRQASGALNELAKLMPDTAERVNPDGSTQSISARNGILVRDRLALERAREIDIVVFDKTGTLTEGKFGVVGIATGEGWDEQRALALAAAIEADSEHTIAQAVRSAASQHKLMLPTISGFTALKGRGAQARLDGKDVYVGGPRLLEMLNLTLPGELAAFETQANQKSQSLVHLVADHQVAASFALADVIRPESKAAIQQLHKMGVQVAMLTGDSQAVAKAVADELGIDTCFAEVLPENKDQKVIELQKQGKRVAMVGDGVNDAPALTRADVGIAIGSGTDVAVESAGIILVKSNPQDVAAVIEISRLSYRKMTQNLVWATGYNVVALPLAAGVLAPVGILLSPAVGALFMSLSTIIVAFNAQLLRGAKLSR